MSRQSTVARVALAPALASAAVLLFPGIALADNCSNLGDCWSSAGGAASAAVGSALGAIGGLFGGGGGSSRDDWVGPIWPTGQSDPRRETWPAPEAPYDPPAPSSPHREFRYTAPDGTVRDSPLEPGASGGTWGPILFEEPLGHSDDVPPWGGGG